VITLATTGDFLAVLLLAAFAGLVGGVAAELLLNRNGETGTFELPARKGAFLDLGGFASLLVGAIVGVAILVVFPPETTIVNSATDGSSTTVRSYDMLRLVATALVAGSAGGSVLTALQARVAAAVNESRVQWTVAASQQQVDQIAELAKEQAAEAIRSVTQPAAGGVRPRGIGDAPMGDVPPAGAGPAEARADEAIASMAAMIDRRAEQARAAVVVAAQRTDRGPG
jgi:hypothetical protein